MTQSPDIDAVHQAAVDWFVRLQTEPDLATWRAFQTWLEADVAHLAAYDAVEAVWVDIEDPIFVREPETAPSVVVPIRRQPTRRNLWIGAAAMAAAVVVAVVLSPQLVTPSYDVYETALGKTRAIVLADGSHLMLGSATRLQVRLSKARREVILVQGEASFDVAHQPGRPFVVTVGPHQVSVLGTEFNILRRAGQIVVTVRRGVVSVAEHGRDQGVRLMKGQQVTTSDGAQPPKVSYVDPNVAFARTQGKLIYRDTPLSRVAVDINQYVTVPIRVDRSASAIKVSGVLRIDAEGAMIEQLTLFTPIDAQARGGEIILMAKAVKP